MKTISRYLLTLALLLTAASGAWADETPLLTIESKDYTSFKSGSKTFDDKVTITFSSSVDNDGDETGWFTFKASLLTVAGINGYTITSCKFYTYDGPAANGYTVMGESPSVCLSGAQVLTDDKSVTIGEPGVKKIEVYGAAAPAEWPLTSQDGKVWTLAEMPANDVELQVEYYAESNLYLSEDALKDKASIAVTAGELGVQFGEDGKSANTVTEGTAMTVKYNGTKKVISVKVAKKAAGPALKTINIGGTMLKYADGETWGEAITNHATENAGWNIVIVEDYPDIFHFVRYNEKRVYCGSAAVQEGDPIDANESYEF